MEILILNTQKDLPISSKAVKPIVEEVLAFENRQTDEVTVHLVDEAMICELHEEHFSDPSPTDCISFPMDEDESSSEDYHILGDVFVCPRTAINYIMQHGGDPYTETTLYIIHGLLHLMGYDDLEDETEAQMRRAEQNHLNNLISKGLVLKPKPAP